jgi:hypothetical protein
MNAHQRRIWRRQEQRRWLGRFTSRTPEEERTYREQRRMEWQVMHAFGALLMSEFYFVSGADLPDGAYDVVPLSAAEDGCAGGWQLVPRR